MSEVKLELTGFICPYCGIFLTKEVYGLHVDICEIEAFASKNKICKLTGKPIRKFDCTHKRVFACAEHVEVKNDTK